MDHTVSRTLILALLVAGCSETHETSRTSTSDQGGSRVSTDTIRLRAVGLVEDDRLATPVRLLSIGRHLVILDPSGDQLIKIVEGDNGKLIARFGRRGDGPGEFRSPWSLIEGNERTSTFWVFDFASRRLTEYQIPPLPLSTDSLPPQRIITLRSPASLSDVIWFGDTSILALGFFDHGRIGKFDSTGRFLDVVGPSPEAGSGIPVVVAQQAYQGVLNRKPDGTAIVVLTRHAGRVEFYSASDGKMITVSKPVDFSPQFSVANGARGPALATGQELRFGYISVATTHNAVVGLFSGHTRAEQPGQANFGSILHVLDWSGQLRAIATLQHPAIAIAIDSTGHILYAAEHSPKPAIRAYSIDELISGPGMRPQASNHRP